MSAGEQWALINDEQTSIALDVAARIAEALIVAGATNSDATATALEVAGIFGARGVHVDITATRIRLFSAADAGTPVTLVRVIAPAPQDFDRLLRVEMLVREIRAGLSPRMALARLDQIDASPRTLPPARVFLSWAIMGGAVAILLGGSLLVALISMIAAFVIMYCADQLSRRGLPLFFQNVAGGTIASLLAALAYSGGAAFGVQLRPSMVVATCIVAMLAGLTLVQAIQNAVTGSPITGYARFFDAIVMTAGIVAGVGVGIMLAAQLGIPLPALEAQAPPNFASSLVRVTGSVLASAAFARACYAPWRSVGTSAVTAAIGSGLYYFVLLPLGVGGVFAAALVAVVIGFIGGLLARRFHVPPVIVSIAGITPLLPGLSIYRGMYGALHSQLVAGFSYLVIALATATALSAGVVFGEWLVRTLSSGRRNA